MENDIEKRIVVEQVGRLKVTYHIPIRTKEEEEEYNREIMLKIYKLIKDKEKYN